MGKYGEHTGSILCAKFIKGYPNVLSFDDEIPPIEQLDSLNYATAIGLALPRTRH